MFRPTAVYVLPEFTSAAAVGSGSIGSVLQAAPGSGSSSWAPRSTTLGERCDGPARPSGELGPEQGHQHLHQLAPAGSFSAMTAIYDTMQFVTCDVAIRLHRAAASAAASCSRPARPGKRMITPGARILIHQPSLGDVVQGDISDLEIQAKELLRTREQLETMLARHTPARTWSGIRTDIERDKVFDAEGAVAYGLVDKVTSSRKTTPPLSACGDRVVPELPPFPRLTAPRGAGRTATWRSSI